MSQADDAVPVETTSDAPDSTLTKPASLPWVSRLVEMDTVSRNSNLGLIETVRDELKRAGIESTLTHDETGQWANLFATVPAHDGEVRGGVVLSGHTDVVPVDGQQWDSDPFKSEVRGDKLYGRGTCDMKGFIGTALTLVPEMLCARLAKPIHFALSFNEEVGCLGAPLMIAELVQRGVKPDGCIVGEPTSMRPIVAHKSINMYRCCVRGHATHSSLTPNGLNAIEYAARLICHIRDLADQFRNQGPFDRLYDVPFTTIQTSTIRGGNAINTVPAECSFEFEFRGLPMLEPETIFLGIEQYAREVLVPKMRMEHPVGSIEFTKIAAAPGLESIEQAAITQLVRALTGDQDKRKVAYATEAGLFSSVGVPSIVCGPGDIQQAHKANEFVELRQLRECERFLHNLIRSMSVDDRAVGNELTK